MFYKLLFTIGLLSIFTGCGDSSSSTNSTQSPLPHLYKVVDNVGEVIQKEFQGYKITIFSDKNLSLSHEISQSTKAIYGNINNTPTNALLKINSNYNQMNIVVKVYKDNQLVGSSKTLNIKDEPAINFGNIIITGR